MTNLVCIEHGDSFFGSILESKAISYTFVFLATLSKKGPSHNIY